MIRLYRRRWFLWDQRFATWSLRHSLQYRALSGQYLIGLGDNRDSFLSLADTASLNNWA